MGKVAKIDAGRVLGIDLLHDDASREAFRNNPELQEKAMKALTLSNYKYIVKKLGNAYLDLPDLEKLAILGYAHNQGASAAARWFKRGMKDSGTDGFGTKGSKYYHAILNK